MYDARRPKLVLCDNLEGWGGDRVGRGVQERGHMCAYGCFILIHDKIHQNIA